MTLISLQFRNGARRVFTDQADIACTKRGAKREGLGGSHEGRAASYYSRHRSRGGGPWACPFCCLHIKPSFLPNDAITAPLTLASERYTNYVVTFRFRKILIIIGMLVFAVRRAAIGAGSPFALHGKYS